MICFKIRIFALRVVICFKIRIFALRQTSPELYLPHVPLLWFALKFVSLRLDKHRERCCRHARRVVICFKIRIFALRQTSTIKISWTLGLLWFALKFVSLRLDKHLSFIISICVCVVICFKIRIFALRQTSQNPVSKDEFSCDLL